MRATGDRSPAFTPISSGVAVLSIVGLISLEVREHGESSPSELRSERDQVFGRVDQEQDRWRRSGRLGARLILQQAFEDEVIESWAAAATNDGRAELAPQRLRAGARVRAIPGRAARRCP
jgi:hypothetical protein